MRGNKQMAILEIQKTLLQLEKEIKSLIQAAEHSQVQQFPGSLRITTVKGKPRYYHKYRDETGHKHSDYISASKNHELITNLAQYSYKRDFLKTAYQQLNAVQNALSSINEESLLNVFALLNSERKKLIIPYIPDKEEYIRIWKDDSYTPGNFSDIIPEIYSEKGERVRSKSEKIIADKYNVSDIPYKYEKPLTLMDRSHPVTIRPDFTVLNKRTLKQLYHEHLGKMDDPKYVRRNIYKLRLYEKNGIFIGDRLFLTMESSIQPLDTMHLDLLIDRYLH